MGAVRSGRARNAAVCGRNRASKRACGAITSRLGVTAVGESRIGRISGQTWGSGRRARKGAHRRSASCGTCEKNETGGRWAAAQGRVGKEGEVKHSSHVAETHLQSSTALSRPLLRKRNEKTNSQPASVAMWQ